MVSNEEHLNGGVFRTDLVIDNVKFERRGRYACYYVDSKVDYNFVEVIVMGN